VDGAPEGKGNPRKDQARDEDCASSGHGLHGTLQPACSAAEHQHDVARHLLRVDVAGGLDDLLEIKLLAAPEDNLFVVGDDDQSIYGWRLACACKTA
jgi:hypothetical protein